MHISRNLKRKRLKKFLKEFYKLYFRQLIKDFYHENTNDVSRARVEDYSSALNIFSALKDTKKLYIDNEHIV